MNNALSQSLHFGVYLVAVVAWVCLLYSGHAQPAASEVFAGIIGAAGGSTVGYSLASKGGKS